MKNSRKISFSKLIEFLFIEVTEEKSKKKYYIFCFIFVWINFSLKKCINYILQYIYHQNHNKFWRLEETIKNIKQWFDI